MYLACILHVSRMSPSYQIHICLDEFEIHVSHYVSRMYLACILITLADTCIPHVSRMYPASQIRTSQDTFGIHVSHYVSWKYFACILHVSSNHCRYIYSACILHVFCMYPAYLLHVSCMYPRTSADTCIPHVFLMFFACIPCVSRMYPACIARAFLAGVPTLQQLQGRARAMKRAKTAAVHLDQLIDLKHLALSYFEPMPAPLTLMPPSGAQLSSRRHSCPIARRVCNGIAIGNFGILGLQGALGAGIGIGNFGILRRGGQKVRLGLQFPVSEFEPQIPDSTTFVGNWEFQRHGISRGLGLQFRNSRISIPSPPLHCRLTIS